MPGTIPLKSSCTSRAPVHPSRSGQNTFPKDRSNARPKGMSHELTVVFYQMEPDFPKAPPGRL